jgi:hypothetical protein
VDALERCQTTEEPFEADYFDRKTNTLWQKFLEYHSEKMFYLTQAFLFEVQMTGKRDFRMTLITLGVKNKIWWKIIALNNFLEFGGEFASCFNAGTISLSTNFYQ